MVRNGYQQPRRVTTAAGVAEVKASRVNGKRLDEVSGERKRFSSAIMRPWCRKSPVTSCPPWSSSSAPQPACRRPRSAATRQWQADHAAFGERDLSGSDYVYIWAPFPD